MYSLEIEFLKFLIKKKKTRQKTHKTHSKKKATTHSTTNTVHMLSSTDDDDDASWSNLGTDLRGEEIVLEDVVGKKKTKEEFEEGDEKELEEKPQMRCGKKDDSPPFKRARVTRRRQNMRPLPKEREVKVQSKKNNREERSEDGRTR